ncbi:MAG TPA: glycosyltransferase [Candidatus Babeliales bacterium]|nr:glycosyltransferase [Candidatus Babeliales bacterium]
MKKRIIIIASLILIVFCFIYKKRSNKPHNTYEHMAPYARQWQNKDKKKIIIFTGKGGQGHLSAAQALREYVGDAYEIETICPIEDILGELDFIHTITFGNFYAEQLYNYCLTHHHIWLVDAMVWSGLQVFAYKYETIKNLIYNYLQEKRPDLILSVITMVNGVTAQAAQELHIPFWVIPTDLDPSIFLYTLHAPSSPQFFFNIPYNLPELYEHISVANIPDTQITYAGFPVRKQFLQSYNHLVVKQEYGIPINKPVVMLMMGGLGIGETIPFVQELAKINTPVHYLICIGKNESLRPRIEKILHNNASEAITYSIIGFTPTIAPLMAISDILITKSGGATINEALYLEIPMIIDGTSRAPQWEYYNRSFIANNECGILLKKVKKLSIILSDLLHNPNKIAAMKVAIQHISKPNPEHIIRNTIATLLK